MQYTEDIIPDAMLDLRLEYYSPRERDRKMKNYCTKTCVNGTQAIMHNVDLLLYC